MNRAKLLIIAGLVCCSAFGAKVQANFAGTWKLNLGKSTQDGPADRVYLKTVEQTDKTIKVTTKAEGVTNVFDGTLTTNGKYRIVKTGDKLFRYTRATWQGATLVLEIMDRTGKKEFSPTVLYIRETWTLSPDGTVLTRYRRTGEAGKGVVDQKYVFDKQTSP